MDQPPHPGYTHYSLDKTTEKERYIQKRTAKHQQRLHLQSNSIAFFCVKLGQRNRKQIRMCLCEWMSFPRSIVCKMAHTSKTVYLKRIWTLYAQSRGNPEKGQKNNDATQSPFRGPPSASTWWAVWGWYTLHNSSVRSTKLCIYLCTHCAGKKNKKNLHSKNAHDRTRCPFWHTHKKKKIKKIDRKWLRHLPLCICVYAIANATIGICLW